MERCPEPELMDDDAQARAYAAADFTEPHNRFAALLLERLPDLPSRGSALDLGCGPADVTMRVARALPQWHIDGVDGSAAMLRYGHAAVVQAGLADRVRLVQIQLPTVTLPRRAYDLVFSNSLLHHLGDPAVLWQSVRSGAPLGAGVFVMDLMRPASRDAAARLVNIYCAGEPEVLRRDFFNSLLAAYRVDEVRQQLRAAELAHLTVAVASDRHLIVWGRL
jgi:SAM-dependent methyltransferase